MKKNYNDKLTTWLDFNCMHDLSTEEEVACSEALNKLSEELINCNICKHINITEENQHNTSIPHVCLIYNKRLFHRSNKPKDFHGLIYPCKECSGKDFRIS